MGGVFVTYAGYYGYRWLDYWVELEGLYRVYGARFADWLSGQLYLWGTVGHEAYADYQYTPFLLGGLGTGLEIILFQHFSIPFEFGYYGLIPLGPGYLQINFGFAGGLRYRF